MFPISLLSLATILSPSLALSPLFLCFLFFLPFASCKPNYISLMHILTTFLSSPLAHRLSLPLFHLLLSRVASLRRFSHLAAVMTFSFLLMTISFILLLTLLCSHGLSTAIPSRSLIPVCIFWKKKKKKKEILAFFLVAARTIQPPVVFVWVGVWMTFGRPPHS